MDDAKARQRLRAALESALAAYHDVSAVEGRALAAHAAFSFLMDIGIELRLLAPLGELAAQDQYEKNRLKGNTDSVHDIFRSVIGAVAVSAILSRAKMGRSLEEIAGVVAKHLSGIEKKALVNFRKEVMAGRKGADAVGLYNYMYYRQMKPALDAVMSVTSPSESDIEKSILLLIEVMTPAEPDKSKV
jgi:hypothetical protein